MPKYIQIIIVFVAITDLVTCGFLIQNRTQPKLTNNKNTTVSVNKDIKPKEVVYDNNEYGFSLELPDEWDKYKTIESKSTHQSWYEVGNINFLLPTTETLWSSSSLPKWYAEVFSILILDAKKWDSIPNHPPVTGPSLGLGTDSIIWRNKKYVFAATEPEWRPDDVYALWPRWFDCQAYLAIFRQNLFHAK